MTELNFNSGKRHDDYNEYDEKFSVSQNGRSADLDTFAMSVDVHTHDRCVGLAREPGLKEMVMATAPNRVQISILDLGADYKSGAELTTAVLSDEGRSRIEKRIQRFDQNTRHILHSC